MLDDATYTPRLKAAYRENIRAALKEEFGYKNDMQIPRLDKIVLNIGVGEATKDTKKVKAAQEALTLIAGQEAVVTRAPNYSRGASSRVLDARRPRGDDAGRRASARLPRERIQFVRRVAHPAP